MSVAEYLEFGFFFIFLLIYIVVAYLGAFHTEWILRTAAGKFIYRNAIPRQMRIFSAIFLTAGLLFLGYCLWQLSNGTFKWIGNPKTYSFADFLK